MIKKPTLILLVGAILIGAAVYYFDWKRSQNPKPAADTSKPAFSFQSDDVTSFTIAHPGKAGDTPVRFEKRNGVWQIVQPVMTQADQSTAAGIVDQLVGARSSQFEPGSPDRLKAYGLDPPQISLDVELRNGAKHKLLIGNKDFTGSSVYTVIDGSQSVALLPDLLLTSTDKPVDELRDRTVLYIETPQVASFDLKNPSGELAAAKDKDGWKLAKPSSSLADKDSIESLLTAISTAKFSSVASEQPQNLGKYGLSNPAVTFTVTDDKGEKSTLLLGKKDGENYFARDAARPMVFSVAGDVYEKLSQHFGEFRNKRVVRLDPADIQRVEIHNANGDIVVGASKENPGQLAIEQPEAQKGKPAAAWRVVDPFTSLRAEDVIDNPPASVLALLTNPAVRATLTGSDGRQLTIRVSKPSGDFVYAQASDSPSVYKLKKQALDDLNIKASDLVL